MVTMNSRRNQYIDIAKGLTIGLMVLGHTSLPDSVARFIWAFHMPLFFIASGWTTSWNRYSVKEFIKRRIKSLMIPFCVYSIVVLTIKEIVIGGGDLVSWFCQGWGGFALWFIPVLFFAVLIGRIVYVVNNLILRYLLMLALIALGAILSYGKISLPWAISTVPYATFLVLLGSELRKLSKYIDYPRWWMLLSGFIFTVIISHFWRLDMAWNKITPVIPITIGAVSGTLMIFTLSSYIAKYTKLCSKVLQAVGRETYIVVAYSQITIIMLNKYFTLNVVVKYVILLVVLIILKYVKDGVNKLAKTKIL